LESLAVVAGLIEFYRLRVFSAGEGGV